MIASSECGDSSLQPTVLVGVTGCVAVYKACEIVRGLQKSGVRVKVVMTEHATEFVGPTTFRALTREPVAVGLFDAPGAPIHHISLAQECDAFLIAPCTANVVGKLASGIADDLLTTTAMATKAPLIVAPAMNVNMYESEALQDNLRTLKARGAHIIEADSGYLACGDTGRGRMPDPERIVAVTLDILGMKRDLCGKRILITAGPTVEPIDPVRFISNHSSGKTGYALAKAAALRGAEVTLVSGPVSIDAPAGVRVIGVNTACQMHEAVMGEFPLCDAAIFTAAVADMRPAFPSEQKLKKGIDDEALHNIELVKNPDILASCGEAKSEHQVVVGFAAETNDVVEHALAKLTSKHADMIVANAVGEGKAFGTPDNEVSFVTVEAVEDLPLMSKRDIAQRILDWISEAIEKRS